MEATWILLLFFGYCLALTEGQLRCYCNEPGCVITGYMCKSKLGKCYTAMESQGEVTLSTHGCLDSLQPRVMNLCSEAENLIKSSDSVTNVPLRLTCCNEHMCNYRETVDNSIVTNSKPNGSSQKGQLVRSPVGRNHVFYSNSLDDRDPDRDLWFKAAVIAVPIAGGFILVLLVLFAVRMLRTDSQRHRRLIQIRRDRGLTKAQLYVADHFSEKSDNSCTLFPEKAKSGSLCRDVNVKVDRGRVYEKVGDHRHSHPSVIMWGKPSKKDIATVV